LDFEVYSVALQDDGKIVVTGTAFDPDYGIYRLLTMRLIGGEVEPPPPPPPPPPVGPDLKGEWTSLTQSCKTTSKGTKCAVKGALKILNIGTVDAPSSLVGFYLSDDDKYDESVDTFLKQVTTGKVKAGGSKTKKLSYRLGTGGSASGKHILAVIDASSMVAEIDETNNVAPSPPLP
jgi:hypothetical protein